MLLAGLAAARRAIDGEDAAARVARLFGETDQQRALAG
jgi:hypothetical protein